MGDLLNDPDQCQHPSHARESHHLASHADGTVDLLIVCNLCGLGHAVGYDVDSETGVKR